MGRIILVRHGQSAWQLDRRGSLDGPLTDLGHIQARATAESLLRGTADRSDTRLVSSPLVRARQTASYFAGRLGNEEVWTELTEAPFRVADHLPRRSSPSDELPSASPLYVAFRAQASAALDHLHQMASDDRKVIAIGHGGLIRTILRVAARSDAVCFDLPNASLTTLEWLEGRWHIAELGRCDHLSTEIRSR